MSKAPLKGARRAQSAAKGGMADRCGDANASMRQMDRDRPGVDRLPPPLLGDSFKAKSPQRQPFDCPAPRQIRSCHPSFNVNRPLPAGSPGHRRRSCGAATAPDPYRCMAPLSPTPPPSSCLFRVYSLHAIEAELTGSPPFFLWRPTLACVSAGGLQPERKNGSQCSNSGEHLLGRLE